MSYEVRPGEIAIVFHPNENKKGEWDGSISTGLIFGKENHPEAMRIQLDMVMTMAATELFLEDNPHLIEDFEYYKSQILQDIFPEAHAEAVAKVKQEEEDNKVIRNGNVLTLTKWTKTEGNA